jgi:hypothetical protein
VSLKVPRAYFSFARRLNDFFPLFQNMLKIIPLGWQQSRLVDYDQNYACQKENHSCISWTCSSLCLLSSPAGNSTNSLPVGNSESACSPFFPANPYTGCASVRERASRRFQYKKINATTARAPKVTPTPIPALALGVRPDDAGDVAVGKVLDVPDDVYVEVGLELGRSVLCQFI